MSQVYVYKSCVPLNEMEEKNTEVVQTKPCVLATEVGTGFFDNDEYVWVYLGIFDIPYNPTENVILIEYDGNFFENVFESPLKYGC
jgi:hypothetical protein